MGDGATLCCMSTILMAIGAVTTIVLIPSFMDHRPVVVEIECDIKPFVCVNIHGCHQTTQMHSIIKPCFQVRPESMVVECWYDSLSNGDREFCNSITLDTCFRLTKVTTHREVLVPNSIHKSTLIVQCGPPSQDPKCWESMFQLSTEMTDRARRSAWFDYQLRETT